MVAARWLATALFLLSIPVFLLLSNVRVAAMEERVYDYAFSHYDAPAVTGLERAELDRAAREIIDYFESPERNALLDISVETASQPEPLFNEREVVHMRDVKHLFHLFFRIHELAFVYLVAYVAGVFLWSRERSMRTLARHGVIAGIATVGVLGLAAVSMLVGFDQLFVQFHLLSFSNDFWQLNPATDRLVQMFPHGFWFDVSLGVGVLTVLQGALLAAGGYAYMEWSDRASERRRRSRFRTRTAVEPPATP
ncbi:MAG: TIGR01906 family membrane protein [Dehalococcoidia bacterium]